MLDWLPHHGPLKSGIPDRAVVTVDSIKRFGGKCGIYQVRWRTTKRRRSILVAIDEWATADQAVANAVADVYPEDARPFVIVPTRAWK